jgi:hypothetical protein
MTVQEVDAHWQTEQCYACVILASRCSINNMSYTALRVTATQLLPRLLHCMIFKHLTRLKAAANVIHLASASTKPNLLDSELFPPSQAEHVMKTWFNIVLAE